MDPKKREEHEGFAFGLSERLEKRFGLGANPEARRKLYKRFELAVEVHGERALVQLKTVAAEAAGARKPDRYFCRAGLCRLREQGLMALGEL
jgi:hypothetical protein